ncbi:MAG: hypothetical protein QMD66_05630 [Actinomycetota bacterium]|nr:hypothetical protein [Actinomycetota bacterium]MDI6822319.1 hypothetical protein [Actinomycetota bacterium]
MYNGFTSALRKEEGYVAIFTTLMVLAVLTVFLTGTIGLTVNGLEIAQFKKSQTNALYVAESGINYALWNLNTPSALGGHADDSTPWRPDGSLEYWLENNKSKYTMKVVDGPGENELTITSKGRVKVSHGSGWVTRTVEVIARKQLPQVFNYAIASNFNLDMSGNAKTNSAPLDHMGNIHANTNIRISGNPEIDGLATATGSIIISGRPTFTQGTQTGVSPVDFPTVNTLGFYNQALVNGETWGDVNISRSGTYVVQGVIHGNLRVSGDAQVEIRGVVYVTGDVRISGNGSTGDGTIVAEGRISLSGNSIYTPGSTNKLAFISLASGNAITISGNPELGGVLYAPNGALAISGNPEIFGAASAKYVYLSGNPTFTYDTDLISDPPVLPGTDYRVVSWKEL